MLQFEKIHGLGNDFVIINALDKKIKNYNELAKTVCNRHFGVGADGMIVAEKSSLADIKMLFFNADGTEASMCGNGIRCFSKFVYDNKLVKEKKFAVETLAGIMKTRVLLNENRVELVQVDIGKPNFSAKEIPVFTNDKSFICKSVDIEGKEYIISALNIGSVNAIIYVDNIKKIDIEREGKAIEKSYLFPEGINVNFVKKISEREIELITWERGVGKTLACGTGAAAAVIIGRRYFNLNSKVNVNLEGGSIGIEEYDDGRIIMTGLATSVFKGEYYNY
ncbi:MAG: diaminopimelate epimerase [Firmicutes bacterium]|nr:diaminopimelate epimerase [Bacillota bacterium]